MLTREITWDLEFYGDSSEKKPTEYMPKQKWNEQ